MLGENLGCIWAALSPSFFHYMLDRTQGSVQNGRTKFVAGRVGRVQQDLRGEYYSRQRAEGIAAGAGW